MVGTQKVCWQYVPAAKTTLQQTVQLLTLLIYITYIHYK